MEKNLEELYFNTFPDLFDKRVDGFACYDGWDSILWDICCTVNEVNRKILDSEKKIKVQQIKEKFGGLRFYISAVPEEYCNEVFKAIDRAERKSYRTCEMCGRWGKIQNDLNWIKCLCGYCHVSTKKKIYLEQAQAKEFMLCRKIALQKQNEEDAKGTELGTEITLDGN